MLQIVQVTVVVVVVVGQTTGWFALEMNIEVCSTIATTLYLATLGSFPAKLFNKYRTSAKTMINAVYPSEIILRVGNILN